MPKPKPSDDIDKFLAIEPFPTKPTWYDKLPPEKQERVTILADAFYSGKLPNFRDCATAFGRVLIEQLDLPTSLQTVKRWLSEHRPKS